MFIIRKFTNQDKQQIVELFEEFQDYVILMDPLKRLRRMPSYGESYTHIMLDEVRNKQGVFYVITNENRILGLCIGIVIKQSAKDLLEVIPSAVGQILELYIRAEYRGKGLGSQLIKKTEEYLKTKGCDVVKLGVFVPNEAAHSFYIKHGYHDRDIQMMKKII